MKKKKSGLEKTRAGDAASAFLSFPADTFREYPVIQVKGNREIVVEGCDCLLDYDRTGVLLGTKFCRINLSGRNLSMRNLSAGVISITGFIESINFK